jgi:hypothetical protein
LQRAFLRELSGFFGACKMVKLRAVARFRCLAAILLVTPLITVTASATAVAAPPDDTPVLLTPKGEHESGEDEESFDKLRDAYYWSRLLAGDDELSFEQAATFRNRAATAANGVAVETKRGAARGGTWASTGPDPVVQVGRTSNTFEAVSGRIGALVIRNDGTIVLGAAQGGVWTYDTATKAWTSRTPDANTQSVGALALAPSDDRIIYLGSGEGALSGDSYYGDGVYRSNDGGVTWKRVSGDQFNGQSTSSITVDPGNPDHLYMATLRGRGGIRRTTAPAETPFGVWESRDGGRHWSLKKGTTDELHGATDLVMDPQNPRQLYASFWGDGIYRTTDGGATWASALGDLPKGNFLEGGTRFALGLSHPAGAAHATIYTGFDYFDLDDEYHPAQIYKTTDEGAHWTATGTGTGADSVFDYCGTQCFYDNVVYPDPTNPDVLYVGGSYGYDNSPQSAGSTGPRTAARRGRASGTTCTRTSTRSPCSGTTRSTSRSATTAACGSPPPAAAARRAPRCRPWTGRTSTAPSTRTPPRWCTRRGCGSPSSRAWRPCPRCPASTGAAPRTTAHCASRSRTTGGSTRPAVTAGR